MEDLGSYRLLGYPESQVRSRYKLCEGWYSFYEMATTSYSHEVWRGWYGDNVFQQPFLENLGMGLFGVTDTEAYYAWLVPSGMLTQHQYEWLVARVALHLATGGG